jgi:PBP4 family serine-type D-alanyl-D-alanine carboxypeptidase
MTRKLLALIAAVAAINFCLEGQAQDLRPRIDQITAANELKHAQIGIEIVDLDSGRVLYSLNPDKLFVPGSTTKLVTEGSALEILGGDYRFETNVYRTGEIKSGTLFGDLVLVASGDPNLSQRIQPDGTLAYRNQDHSYGHLFTAQLVPGDPLMVLNDFARQISASGIKRIRGRVRVDADLFSEGGTDPGTGFVLSPVVINDNVIDVLVTAGPHAGDTAKIEPLPATSYARFTSELRTVAAGTQAEVAFKDTRRPDGTYDVRVTGQVPVGTTNRPFPYGITEPSRFAEIALTEALTRVGAKFEAASPADVLKPNEPAFTKDQIVARHVSPPFREAVKIALKVSQNVHSSITPMLLGAIRANDHEHSLAAGFKLQREFLEQNGLDVSAAAQSDGAGGNSLFTPHFMTQFLLMMARQKDFADFRSSLPILGRDGTLWNIQSNSPAAGRVFAKTGTHVLYNALGNGLVINGKGLAGYIDTRSGKRLAFCAYFNHVPVSLDLNDLTKVSDLLGQIAVAAYDQ